MLAAETLEILKGDHFYDNIIVVMLVLLFQSEMSGLVYSRNRTFLKADL